MTAHYHHDFTAEDDAMLVKGKNEGLSLGQICVKYFPTYTRNSLAGRWYRLRMSEKREIRLGGSKPKKRAEKQQKPAVNRAPKPKAKSLYAEEPQALLRRPVRFQALKPHMCKWPVNDPGPKEYFMFCGMRRVKNVKAPYCSVHTKLAYR